MNVGAYRNAFVRPRRKRQDGPERYHAIARRHRYAYRITNLFILIRARPIRGYNGLSIRHRRQGTECQPKVQCHRQRQRPTNKVHNRKERKAASDVLSVEVRPADSHILAAHLAWLARVCVKRKRAQEVEFLRGAAESRLVSATRKWVLGIVRAGFDG